MLILVARNVDILNIAKWICKARCIIIPLAKVTLEKPSGYLQHHRI